MQLRLTECTFSGDLLSLLYLSPGSNYTKRIACLNALFIGIAAISRLTFLLAIIDCLFVIAATR